MGRAERGHQLYPHLFQETMWGKLKVKNRIKYGACCVSNYNTRDGYISPRELARTEAIFAGGSSGAALWGVRQLAARLTAAEGAARRCEPLARALTAQRIFDWLDSKLTS